MSENIGNLGNLVRKLSRKYDMTKQDTIMLLIRARSEIYQDYKKKQPKTDNHSNIEKYIDTKKCYAEVCKKIDKYIKMNKKNMRKKEDFVYKNM